MLMDNCYDLGDMRRKLHKNKSIISSCEQSKAVVIKLMNDLVCAK